MHPTLILNPRAPFEVALIAVLSAAAIVLASLAKRTASEDARLPRLLGVHLAGWTSLLFLLHASVSRTPLVISTFALTAGCGVLLTWRLLFPRLRAMGIPLHRIFFSYLGGLACGLVRSRLAHGLTELLGAVSMTAWLAELAAIRRGGLGMFGAVAFIGLHVWLLFRVTPHRPAAVLDASTSSLALGLAIGRLGCVLAGCCHGVIVEGGGPWTLPVRAFAIDSPAGSAHADLPEACLWPTQPIEALALALIALASEARRDARSGSTTAPCARSPPQPMESRAACWSASAPTATAPSGRYRVSYCCSAPSLGRGRGSA